MPDTERLRNLYKAIVTYCFFKTTLDINLQYKKNSLKKIISSRQLLVTMLAMQIPSKVIYKALGGLFSSRQLFIHVMLSKLKKNSRTCKVL